VFNFNYPLYFNYLVDNCLNWYKSVYGFLDDDILLDHLHHYPIDKNNLLLDNGYIHQLLNLNNLLHLYNTLYYFFHYLRHLHNLLNYTRYHNNLLDDLFNLDHPRHLHQFLNHLFYNNTFFSNTLMNKWDHYYLLNCNIYNFGHFLNMVHYSLQFNNLPLLYYSDHLNWHFLDFFSFHSLNLNFDHLDGYHYKLLYIYWHIDSPHHLFDHFLDQRHDFLNCSHDLY
jgi:hypothetical protein